MTTPSTHPVSPGDVARLRSAARAGRAALDATTRRGAETAIVESLLGLDEFQRPGGPGRESLAVGWYMPTDGEVDLGGAVEELRRRGHSLWLPVIGEARTMDFGRWDSHTPLGANRYGIPEPVVRSGPSAHGIDRVAATALDVVVVPSVVLDPAGHRLGFGAGYYDRALADSNATTIGVGFALQLVDALQPEPWDITLDIVLTERGVSRPKANHR